MTKPVQSTQPSTCAVPHQAKWISLLESRACEEGVTYAFTDGSSNGGFGCVIVRSGETECHSDFKKPDKSRNVGAELEGFLLALRSVRFGETVTIVSDYLGAAAWMTGNWKIKDPLVRSRIDEAKRIIEELSLTVRYVHHGGHQRDRSDFTCYNELADKLASRTS